MIHTLHLTFSSSYITDLDSDTLIGYVLAHMQDADRDQILNTFNTGTIPFAVSCGFPAGFLPRFFDLGNNEQQVNDGLPSLAHAITNESTRKASKKLRLIPLAQHLAQQAYWQKRANKESLDEVLNTIITQQSDNVHHKSITSLTTHATIDRQTQEATPYPIASQYPSHDIVIYIAEYNTHLTKLFVDEMIRILSTIGRGKAKSRGYGHLTKIEKKESDSNERSVFELMQGLNTQGLFPIINHYFPSEKDKQHIDRENSQINLITKNAKRGGEYVFKGNITYIAPGSVIVTKDKYQIQGSVLIDKPDNNTHPSYSIASAFLFSSSITTG